MDITERWLREHDPEYESTKKNWTQKRTVRNREVLRGLLRKGESVVSEQRICEGCLESFTPERIGHTYCSEKCEAKLRMRDVRSKRAISRESSSEH